MPVGPTHLLGPATCRPVVSFAVLLAIGVTVGGQWDVTPWALVGVAALVGASAMVLPRSGAGTLLLAACVLCCGGALATRERLRFPADDIGLFATADARLATIEATIADEPRVVAPAAAAGRPLPPHEAFVAEVGRVLTTHGWAAASGSVPVRLDDPSAALAAGQTVRLLGLIQRPTPAANPGEFDWAAYYRRDRITATFTVRRAANARVVAGPGFAPRLWVRARVAHLLAAGFPAARAGEAAVLRAVLLGEHDPDFTQVADDFRQAGVAYHLSVSGLHVALLAGAVLWACRRARLRPRVTTVGVTLFTLAFAAVSAPSHSGGRAVGVSAVLAAGLLVRRTASRPQLIALVVVALLVWHPLDVFSGGFQLSAAAVVAFLLLAPTVRRWRADPDRPARRPAVTRLRRWGGGVGRVALVVTLAWLATVPLVMIHFGQVTPWAVPGGLAMYPLAVGALFGGAAKVVGTTLWPSSAGPLAAVAAVCPAAMRAVAHGLTLLPGGGVPVPPPPAWAVVGYYALLLLPVVVGRSRPLVRWSPVAGLAGLLAISLGPDVTAASGGGGGAGLRVTLLSLGAGQCAIVEPPGGPAAVVDAGSTTVPDVEHRLIGPFLDVRGVRHLGPIFLSHGDFDHISGAGDLAAAFGADGVFTSHHFRRHAFRNEPDLELLARLDDLHRPPRELAVGNHVDLGGGAGIDVLWPPPVGLWGSNDAGLVLRLTYAGRRVLFPADIQNPAFAGLLKHPARLAADVLVAAHHGSSETLTPAFLAAVHPSLIVSSNAARLTAKQRLFDAMVPAGVPLYRTPKCGAITVTITPDGRVSVGTYLRPAE